MGGYGPTHGALLGWKPTGKRPSLKVRALPEVPGPPLHLPFRLPLRGPPRRAERRGALTSGDVTAAGGRGGGVAALGRSSRCAPQFGRLRDSLPSLPCRTITL